MMNVYFDVQDMSPQAVKENQSDCFPRGRSPQDTVRYRGRIVKILWHYESDLRCFSFSNIVFFIALSLARNIKKTDEKIVVFVFYRKSIEHLPILSPYEDSLLHQNLFSNMFDQDRRRKSSIQYLEKGIDGLIRYSKAIRRIPLLSMSDTMIEGVSEHGEATIFEESEIIATEEIEKVFLLGPKKLVCEADLSSPLPKGFCSFAEKLKGGRFVVQQQASRGCMAAVAAMLIADHKGIEAISPDVMEKLRTANLMSETCQRTMLEKSGLTLAFPSINGKDLFNQLSEAIRQDGSIITTVSDPQGGGHVVVVDEVDREGGKVLLREPYHGIAMWVTGSSFLLRKPHRFIQVLDTGH